MLEVGPIMIKLIQGDCLEKMKEIESVSIDLILTDPPYGTVKGLGDGDVNHGMKNKTNWDETICHKSYFEECNRILRTNGALILFSQEPYTSKLITEAHGNVPFSYRKIWKKDHFANSLIAKKAPVSYFEDICVFFKKYDTLAQHPLREYSEDVKIFIGLEKHQVFKRMGHQGVCHFYRTDSTQFGLCTEKTYRELIDIFKIDEMEDFKSFKEMQQINNDFKFHKVFNLHEGKKYKSNILEYKKDYTGYHPTQKPVLLLEDLIKTYTNKGETVLDFTMGSGSTGVAAKNLNRKFIGIELDPEYFKVASDRILEAGNQSSF